MPTADSIAVAAKLSLIQSVDDGRSPEDPHKLPGWLRLQVDRDLEALDQSESETVINGAEQTDRSTLIRQTVEQLETHLREGYRGITAIRSTLISDGERAAVFAAYGWSGGLLGRFGTSRTVGLAWLAVREHPEVPVKFRYAPDLIADLQASLKEYSRLVPEEIDGAQGATVQSRNAKLDAAEETLSQVRYAYCMASRATVKNPELLKIGFRPRRAQRTKEEIETAKQRADTKRQENEAKRLQRIDDREQRELDRLAEAIERTRMQAARERGSLGRTPERTNEPEAMPQAEGDVTLSS